MRTLGFCLLLGVSGLALTWLSGQVGWWWVTPLVGVLIGLLLRPAWLALVTSLAAGGLGWGLPLALLAFTAPVGRLAAAVEAVFRLPATGGTIIILLTKRPKLRTLVWMLRAVSFFLRGRKKPG